MPERGLDGTDASDHCGRFRRQRGVARAEPAARLHGQQVRAQRGDLGVEIGPARLGQAQHADHRGDADRDTQRGQHRADSPGAETGDADGHHIGPAEPAVAETGQIQRRRDLLRCGIDCCGGHDQSLHTALRAS